MKQVEDTPIKSSNKLKMKTKISRNDGAGGPYPKRRSGESVDKQDKPGKERKNLGSFKHTFHPPEKSTPKTTATATESTKDSVLTPPSSTVPRVSVKVKNEKTDSLLKGKL